MNRPVAFTVLENAELLICSGFRGFQPRPAPSKPGRLVKKKPALQARVRNLRRV